MTDEAKAVLQRLRTDFAFFAASMLRVRSKSGDILPLKLNRPQRHLLDRLTEQKRATGKVRALVLKGRQQGISTFLEGWFYWRISGEQGKRAFILTHEQKASDNLFEMAQRYHDLLPDWFRPSTGACNAKELYFDKLDSGYQVATAGSKDTGRSSTAQYLHGSEVAFWPNAETHMAALGQIVPDMAGTEIVLESTANGVGGLFHKLWQEAESGASDYIAIFIPWFWSEEYRRPVPAGWQRTAQEDVYATAHGLDDEQLAWRRNKIASDFLGDESRFRQEYPATASEAFVAVGHEPWIAPSLVLAAQAARRVEGGPLVVGVDPARFGDDATGIVRRRGRVVLPNVERIRKESTMQIAGRVAVIIRDEKPQAVFIDVGGLGAGVFDRLVEMGYGDTVTAVNFGERALREERWVNKRAEMWGEMKTWLTEQPAFIPAEDVIMGDLTGPKFSFDSNGRMKLESKDDMRKRGVKSPDVGDALALTFAFPVAFTANRNADVWEELEEAMTRARDDESWRGIHTG